MNRSALARCLCLVFLLCSFTIEARGANGGTDCAACVILVGLVEQLAQVHSVEISEAASMFCSYLPGKLADACQILLERFGPSIIDAIYYNETPDLACHSIVKIHSGNRSGHSKHTGLVCDQSTEIGICTQDPGKDFCHLFPLPATYEEGYERNKHAPLLSRKIVPASVKKELKDVKIDICMLPGIKELCQHVNDFADDHLPIQDADSDKFSAEVNVLRGAMWRGRDCNDARPDYYPGRMAYNHDENEDSNCNGIHGVDPSTGMPFEQTFCANTGQKGLILLGDSAGAHFHIPPEYLMAETLNVDTFQDALMLIANEGDWPMMSSSTAYSTTNSWPHSIDGPIDSLYLRLRNHNLCNHRDFQNIGVNGARSSSMRDIVKSMARIQHQDHPAIVILSLVGNDVCNGHVDTISHMTTPDEFRSNTMDTLTYLDTVLPKGSTVFVSGLADGRVLWNTLYNRIHPIGELNKDVTYQELYDFLNCLEVSPCTGWMNSNATLRDLTSERAADLSAQAMDIAEKEKFTNFDVHYIDFNVQEVINTWEKMGGEAWEVIEPVDGFHPGQIAQALSASYLWDVIKANYADAIGEPNPNNEKIRSIFADQGGY